MATKPTLNDLMYEYYFGLEGTPVTAAGAPTSPVATAGAGFVSVAFVAPASTGSEPILGYEVTLSNGRVASGTSSPIVVPTPGGSAVTATVKAFNGALGVASAASNSVTPTVVNTVPGAPTSPVATPGDGQVSVAFTAPASTGGVAIDGYRVTLSNGLIGSGPTSPVIVLTPNTFPVTATVAAHNALGWGSESVASNSVTPQAVANVSIGIIAANRTNIPSRRVSVHADYTTRRSHWAHPAGTVTNLRTVDVGWYCQSGTGYIAMGIANTIKRFIEYPVGVFTQLTFGGQPTGDIPNGGQLVSDPCPVVIPAGAQFFTRTVKLNATSNMGFIDLPAAPDVLGLPDGNAGTDMGNSGEVPQGTSTTQMGPAMILGDVGVANARSAVVFGDSIVLGAGDVTSTSSKGSSGYVGRGLDPTMAWTAIANGGVQAAEMASLTGVLTPLLALAKFTDGIVEFGVNDLALGKTPAQLVTSLGQLHTLLAGPGRTLYQTTLTPRTSSTDSWATSVNQTPRVDGNWSQASAVNDTIRAGLAGVNKVIEVADVAMTARNSNLWVAPPVPSTDGVHPNTARAITLAVPVASAIV